MQSTCGTLTAVDTLSVGRVVAVGVCVASGAPGGGGGRAGGGGGGLALNSVAPGRYANCTAR